MKKLLLFVFVLSIMCFTSNAQRVPQLNTIKVGVSRVGLDAPDAIGHRYEVQYVRIVGNPRIKVSARVGFQQTVHPSLVSIIDNQRKRKTLDLVLSYNVLKSHIHHLSPGVGFSFWHRDDAVVQQASFDVKPGGSKPELSYTIARTKELNIGPYFSLEYELRIMQNISFSAQVGLNMFEKAGNNSNIGLSVGYHF